MHQFIYEDNIKDKLRFEVSFFTVDIFHVKFTTHENILQDTSDEPSFPPPEARVLIGQRHAVKIDFQANKSELHLSSDAVEISIQKQPFRMVAVRRGETAPFWKQRLSDLFTGDGVPTSIVQHQGRIATFEAFTLGPDEALFGLGERFDSVTRRGKPVDFVNHDAIGTSNTKSYINVPFFWSTAGYGCFINSYARTEWDMGMSEAGSVGFCTEEDCMDYFTVSGSTPKEILGRYTKDLTGTPVMPPTWSFGLWLSRTRTSAGISLIKCLRRPSSTGFLQTTYIWIPHDARETGTPILFLTKSVLVTMRQNGGTEEAERPHQLMAVQFCAASR